MWVLYVCFVTGGVIYNISNLQFRESLSKQDLYYNNVISNNYIT